MTKFKAKAVLRCVSGGLLAIWIVVGGCRAEGQQIVTATVTVTNAAGTTNGETISVNGVLRTFTNNVVAANVQIAMGTNIGIATSNLFLAYAIAPQPSTILGKVSTNGVTFQGFPGAAMAVLISTNWATVSFATNTITPIWPLRLPLAAAEGPAMRTNLASALMAALRDQGDTNAFYESDPSVAHLMGLTNNQTVPGAKQLTNYGNVINGTMVANEGFMVTNAAANVANFYIMGSAATGGRLGNIQMTPANMIFSIGGGQAFVFNNPIYLGGDLSLFNYNIIGGKVAISTNGFTGNGSGVTNLNGANIQPSTVSTAQLNTNGLAFAGTNTFTGDIAYKRFAITTLANGVNSDVLIGTNEWVEVSGASAAFSIAGLAGSPNRDGKEVWILNQGGQAMTLSHQSGSEVTVANRIICLTGADITVAGNSAALLRYSAAVSRWIVHYFGSGSGTAASGWSLSGNVGVLPGGFLGTVDSQALVLKANNVQMASFSSASGLGNVVLGINNSGGGVGGNAIGGGANNNCDFNGPNTIVGGSNNRISGGQANVILGGSGNIMSNYVNESVILGGYFNYVVADHALAGGYGAVAKDTGAFVWADSQGPSFYSNGSDSFNVRAGGGIWLADALHLPILTTATNYTLASSDSTVLLNAATLTATLPTAVGIKGRTYTIKEIASSSGTVATTSSQNIDGVTTFALSAQYKAVTVQSDGANWWVLSVK